MLDAELYHSPQGCLQEDHTVSRCRPGWRTTASWAPVGDGGPPALRVLLGWRTTASWALLGLEDHCLEVLLGLEDEKHLGQSLYNRGLLATNTQSPE